MVNYACAFSQSETDCLVFYKGIFSLFFVQNVFLNSACCGFVSNHPSVARVRKVWKNLMTALFVFFVALVISLKQKNSSAVRSTRYLGTHLTNGRTAFRLEAGGRATLNSTGISSRLYVENSTSRKRLWSNSEAANQLHANFCSQLQEIGI